MSKTSAEIRSAINLIVAEQVAMNEIIEQDKRSFTDAEQEAYDAIEARYQAAKKELEQAEQSEKIKRRAAELAVSNNQVRSAIPSSQPKAKDYRNYSVLKAVRGMANNRLDGFEAEVHEEMRNQAGTNGIQFQGVAIPSWAFTSAEKRAGSITSASDTNALVELDGGLIDALRNKTVIGSLGATFMSGLSGSSVEMPKLVTGAATWAATEIASATGGGQAFERATLSPKRLASFLDVSKQFIAQTSFSAEAVLVNDMVMQMAIALDKAAINGAGSGGTPLGVLGLTGGPEVDFLTADATWAKIVAMESAAGAANSLRGAMAYLTSYEVMGSLKTISKDTGSGRFLAEGMLSSANPENVIINGYRGVASPHIPIGLGAGTDESAIIFGHWNDLLVGQFGASAVDVTVDNITKAITGEIRLVTNGYFDITVRHKESFVLGTAVTY